MLPDLSWTHDLEDILNYIDTYFKVINYFKKNIKVNYGCKFGKFYLSNEKFVKK